MQKTCPYVKLCGGCQQPPLPYEKQLEQKQAAVAKLMAPYGKCRPILGMKEPYYYRNKAIATFAPFGKNKFQLGIYARGSHKVIPVKDCLLQNESLNQVLDSVAQAAAQCHLPAYDEDKRSGLLRHVVLRHSRSTGEVLCTIVTASPVFPGSRQFIKTLRSLSPQVTSVVQNINPAKTSSVLSPYSKTLYGPGYIVDKLCGLDFSISSRSFYQVNPEQTELLYQKAMEMADLSGQERVLDTYCGIGTIGLCASAHCGQVLGVEINKDAVGDAIYNAKRNHIQNASFIEQDATNFMKELAAQGEKVDVIFMDPPRSGSTPEFLRAAAKMAPEKIVYISCDPSTQARDLAFITKLDYNVKEIQPVDLFPHTEHVETVVLLSKGEIDSKKVRVEFSLEDMDTSGFQQGATYGQIKERVLEQSGLKVSSLYISQVKRKCGLEVGQNHNLSKKENAKQPQCPPEKEVAIMEALKYFQMI